MLEQEAESEILNLAPPPWVLRRCKKTGIVYLENPPGYEVLHDEMAWQVTYKRESEARAAVEPVRYAVSTVIKKMRHALKRNKIADLTHSLILQTNSPQIRVLDLGCGWGKLLGIVMDQLPPDVWQRCIPYGIEISTELAELSQQALAPFQGRCVHASALDGLAQFETSYFDIIVMSSFLEHEIQPLPLLKRSAERLRDGGYVIIKVPNYDSWNRHMRGERWCGFRWPDHVNYFTPDTLRAMATAAGFNVVRMNFLDRLPLSDSLYAVLQKKPA